MRQIVITTLLLASVALSGGEQAYAQRAVFNRMSRTMTLDCSKESGMSQTAVTTTRKYTGPYKFDTGTGTGTYNGKLITIDTWLSTGGGNGTIDESPAKENEKIYYKLEIDSENLTIPNVTPTSMTWVDAFNGCKNKKEPGWRLPTLRELVLIYLFRGAILEATSIEMKEEYVSVTERNYGTYQSVVFDKDNPRVDEKSKKAGSVDKYVRCVREL